MSKPTRKTQVRRQTAKKVTHQQQKNRENQRQKLEANRANEDPKPAPVGRAYFIQQIWEKLGLEAAMNRLGIVKDGLPLSTIFLVTLLMGVVGATSLNNTTTLLPHDAALMTMLAIDALDEKQLYRGLARVSITQYQAWMGYLLGQLQVDPRTASRPDGVVAGDGTQIAKPDAHKIPGVHVMFLHSEKRFVRGMEVASTHYADSDKDYPLFMAFYEPDEDARAERAAKKERRKAQVDGRKPKEVLAYLEKQVTQGNQPELIVLSGPQLNYRFRQGIDKLALRWLGVGDNRRVYTLVGQKEKQKAKTLLSKANPKDWEVDVDSGYHFADLGVADSSIGMVRLVVAEHMADGTRTLYTLPDTVDIAESINRISWVLSREQAKQEKGMLNLMLNLLSLGQEAGIRAETATFDRWFFVPWFIVAVLGLGFKRVVIKAKAGFTYVYKGEDHTLDSLWGLLKQKDFHCHTRGKITYELASLEVTLKGVGQVKLVFVRQPTRRGNKILSSVLMCTDTAYEDKRVLRAYLLRWQIEVCYREVKQNHAFGTFHSQNMETNYGQTMLSLVAYLFVTLLRLLLPPLRQHTLGWIKNNYLNVTVRLVENAQGAAIAYIVEFAGWFLDTYGLPDWDSFRLPDSVA
jgi:hypothetical protein